MPANDSDEAVAVIVKPVLATRKLASRPPATPRRTFWAVRTIVVPPETLVLIVSFVAAVVPVVSRLLPSYIESRASALNCVSRVAT